MSYLVDALKKAERERHHQPGADMQSLSDGEQTAVRRGGSGALRWIVIALVVCNLGLLVYLLGGRGDTSAQNASPPAASTASKQPASAPRQAPKTASSAPAEPGGAAAPDRDENEESGQALSGLRLSGDPNVSTAGRRSSQGGQVTYAREPLDDAPTSASAAAPGQPASAPTVDINGHLYSSVPGRSFILVNGQRYHEGERLAAGPAVESIDSSGATLNYRGHRYHVKGPG